MNANKTYRITSKGSKEQKQRNKIRVDQKWTGFCATYWRRDERADKVLTFEELDEIVKDYEIMSKEGEKQRLSVTQTGTDQESNIVEVMERIQWKGF